MSANLDLQVDEPFAGEIQPDQLERALTLTLSRFHPQLDQPTITLVITDNETVQQLNWQYRGLDTPTDVLSFVNVPDSEFPGSDDAHLGDIVIAYPVARAQADAGGHPPMAELILLAVHGALHLLGFEHDTPAEKHKMWSAQQEIMVELGLGYIQPTEN